MVYARAMISQRVFQLCVAAGCLLSPCLSSGEESQAVRCEKSRLFLAPLDSSDHRKYAPDREIDLLNLALDITPDFKQRQITGKATLTFRPIAKPIVELRLDAVDLNVQSVTSTEALAGYQLADKKLVVTFKQPISPGREVTL